MPTLAEIRAQYPQYKDLSDNALADGLYKKFYSDMPRDQFNTKIGLSAPKGKEGAPQQSILDKLWFQIKGIPKGVASGLAGTAAAMGQAEEPMTAAAVGQKPIATPTQQEGEQLIEKHVTGELPKGGRLGEAVGEAIGTPSTYLAPGGLLAKLGSAAGSAVGGELAGKAAEGTRFENLARVGGSFAGGFPFGRWRTPQANAKSAVPLAEDLFEAGDHQLNAARNLDIQFKPASVATAGEEAAARLTDRDLTRRVVPKTWEVVDEIASLKKAPKDAYVRGGQMMRALGELKAIARENPGTSESTAAWQVIDRLSSYLGRASEADVAKGNLDQFKTLFNEGSANWAAGKRLDMLAGQVKLGQFNAATAHSGRNVDNSLRQAIKQLIKPRPGKKTLAEQHGFSDREIQAMQQVAKGGPLRNTVRYFGNLLAGGGGWGSAMLGLGGAAVGTGLGYTQGQSEAGAALGAMTGLGFRSIANAMARREAAKVLGTVAGRSPLAQERKLSSDINEMIEGIAAKRAMKASIPARAAQSGVRAIPQITVHPKPRKDEDRYGGPL